MPVRHFDAGEESRINWTSTGSDPQDAVTIAVLLRPAAEQNQELEAAGNAGIFEGANKIGPEGELSGYGLWGAWGAEGIEDGTVFLEVDDGSTTNRGLGAVAPEEEWTLVIADGLLPKTAARCSPTTTTLKPNSGKRPKKRRANLLKRTPSCAKLVAASMGITSRARSQPLRHGTGG